MQALIDGVVEPIEDARPELAALRRREVAPARLGDAGGTDGLAEAAERGAKDDPGRRGGSGRGLRPGGGRAHPARRFEDATEVLDEDEPAAAPYGVRLESDRLHFTVAGILGPPRYDSLPRPGAGGALSRERAVGAARLGGEGAGGA